jgi:PEP-CTERM motif
MSMRRLSFTTLLILTVVGQLNAAPFQNLDFEQATTNTLTIVPMSSSGFGPISDLLPAWQGFDGNRPLSTIGYNVSLAYNPVLLFGPEDHVTVISGRYSVLLNSLASASGGGPTIAQTGDVPSDAAYLIFDERGQSTHPFTVSINGQVLPNVLPPFPSGSEAFDVSRFDGQTVELRINTDLNQVPGISGGGIIDNIRFISVPEPTTLGLLFMAGGFFWMRLRRRDSPS